MQVGPHVPGHQPRGLAHRVGSTRQVQRLPRRQDRVTAPVFHRVAPCFSQFFGGVRIVATGRLGQVAEVFGRVGEVPDPHGSGEEHVPEIVPTAAAVGQRHPRLGPVPAHLGRVPTQPRSQFLKVPQPGLGAGHARVRVGGTPRRVQSGG